MIRNKDGGMKRLAVLLLILAMVSGITACSSNGKQVKNIYIYQNKPEIDEALKKVTAAYTAEHPDVQFTIETIGENYFTILKTKQATGDLPDVFTVIGNQGLGLWQSQLEDLSDQPWTADMIDLAKDEITGDDGKIYGLPLAIEGYGYVYNKELFKQAGIAAVPVTFSELKEDITNLKTGGVQPLIGAYLDWYQAGNFLINIGIARQEDPQAFIRGLYDGTSSIVGNKTFEELAEFIQYDFANGKDGLNTSFNAQTSKLINGEVAVTLGGNASTHA
ncbi:carbohydrate ABC transporter substrate-binding protein [Paenibacillus albidus]|uniref:ABC transporter substrate-binding protein n=1 Tax=Paenibacillus albidus TaxID=2041023 RepID=UPI001BEC824F|nr:ABC transporter substrate-binding protein [Paenibacillus albidus]MBT2290163.1 carbohydrate ABC transporter substrate-binding protein [Paenibacillus albidus]